MEFLTLTAHAQGLVVFLHMYVCMYVCVCACMCVRASLCLSVCPSVTALGTSPSFYTPATNVGYDFRRKKLLKRV